MSLLCKGHTLLIYSQLLTTYYGRLREQCITDFAEFLLENANNGEEILAVLDDIVEVRDTAL